MVSRAMMPSIHESVNRAHFFCKYKGMRLVLHLLRTIQ